MVLKNAFKCKDGRRVSHPQMAAPHLHGINTGSKGEWPLLRTYDDGKTWEVFGYFRNSQKILSKEGEEVAEITSSKLEYLQLLQEV